ncbi:hypothetical protein J2Z21_006027 [Streptomyces griseochromogenes]|uniref:Uncharacterized protein n=1 Tax=Streptomyces griseochromogenes TaxID=68214 RepID=A0A1B1ASJ1_9ACTN|nr:hypothetical protein [Streptomyces griseochromogenes]ANP49524.1 hypothetical protein AVL59_07815 [Streptomyces griseochromogenes]MBP2053036.1 hypothetical protein [Streptomyces griseochromogenes]
MTAGNELIDPARLAKLDWEDLAVLHDQLSGLLDELATSEWLSAAFDQVLATPELLVQSERLQELDRVVLVNDAASGVRVRLHVFRQREFDRPHNHRWTFGNRVLAGSYRHYLYGDYEDLTTHTKIGRPCLVRDETPGTGYVIRHTLVHSVAAVPDTTSLIVRGPAAKDRFVVMNNETGDAWWQYGHQVEDEAEIARRRLGAEKVTGIRDLLVRQGVIR